MFTQNAMRAFRSVLVALLIGSVFPRWCAADESKVDASVRTALQTQSTVEVVISLQDEPPIEQICAPVKAEFKPGIEAKSAEIRARIRPFHQRDQALPPNVKAEVRMMHQSLKTQTHQMHREIIRRLENRVAPSQQRVRAAIENAGGTVYAEVAIVNIMGARLSATAVTQVAALDDVTRIKLEPVQVPALAGSAPIIYAPRFWEDGYNGGMYNVGIVETSGVEDEHSHLRSKAAGKLIERQPNAVEPPPDYEVPFHGTAVAGIVAMKAYTDAEGEHKGIAYGLDKILDATNSSFSGAIKAMQWAMSNPSDDAAVLNYSYSLRSPEHGDRMDNDEPDYSVDYGVPLDQVIHAHEVLIIQPAGNYSTSDKKEYTLGWGADAYNGIVVGASTAGKAGERRLDNEVRDSSGRGPTPGGRKKPDVVAPGEDITTTILNGRSASVSGTSAAVPHVAGAILLFADHGLSDPMVQKALLINSAEDRGPAGWDKDWGWGYIDLYTALEQYDYTISDSIERRASDDDGANDDDGASDDGRGVRWYKGTMTGCQTATLVWHKRPGEPLINLDMYLYNEKRDKMLSESNSVRDNVEQVKMPKGHDGTVYIKIVYNVAHGQLFRRQLSRRLRFSTAE